MIFDALGLYLESVSAFWFSFAGGGGLRLILICCLIYWIFCKRGRRCGGWRCCSACGCLCGRCRCDDAADGDEDANGDDSDSEAEPAAD